MFTIAGIFCSDKNPLRWVFFSSMLLWILHFCFNWIFLICLCKIILMSWNTLFAHLTFLSNKINLRTRLKKKIFVYYISIYYINFGCTLIRKNVVTRAFNLDSPWDALFFQACYLEKYYQGLNFIFS